MSHQTVRPHVPPLHATTSPTISNISQFISSLTACSDCFQVFIFWMQGELLTLNLIAITGDPTTIPSESEIPFQPSSEIWCTGQAGFGFVFVKNLLIENLSFTNCGTPFSSHSNLSSAILFPEVTNLTISLGSCSEHHRLWNNQFGSQRRHKDF